MNMHRWMVGFAGVLTAGTIVTLAPMNLAQTLPQTPPAGISEAEHNQHHPDKPPTPEHSPNHSENHHAHMDRHFIEMMIPHHQNAIATADLALVKAKNPELKQLAQAIKDDRTREIDQMRTWYQQWFGQEVPTTSPMNHGTNHQNGTNPAKQMGCEMMGKHDRGGMQTDLNQLKAAADFDREFIRQMIPHHQMAVKMAQKLQKHSTRPEMKALAQAMIKTQTLEINQLQQGLKPAN